MNYKDIIKEAELIGKAHQEEYKPWTEVEYTALSLLLLQIRGEYNVSTKIQANQEATNRYIAGSTTCTELLVEAGDRKIKLTKGDKLAYYYIHNVHNEDCCVAPIGNIEELLRKVEENLRGIGDREWDTQKGYLPWTKEEYQEIADTLYNLGNERGIQCVMRREKGEDHLTITVQLMRLELYKEGDRYHKIDNINNTSITYNSLAELLRRLEVSIVEYCHIDRVRLFLQEYYKESGGVIPLISVTPTYDKRPYTRVKLYYKDRWLSIDFDKGLDVYNSRGDKESFSNVEELINYLRTKALPWLNSFNPTDLLIWLDTKGIAVCPISDIVGFALRKDNREVRIRQAGDKHRVDFYENDTKCYPDSHNSSLSVGDYYIEPITLEQLRELLPKALDWLRNDPLDKAERTIRKYLDSLSIENRDAYTYKATSTELILTRKLTDNCQRVLEVKASCITLEGKGTGYRYRSLSSLDSCLSWLESNADILTWLCSQEMPFSIAEIPIDTILIDWGERWISIEGNSINLVTYCKRANLVEFTTQQEAISTLLLLIEVLKDERMFTYLLEGSKLKDVTKHMIWKGKVPLTHTSCAKAEANAVYVKLSRGERSITIEEDKVTLESGGVSYPSKSIKEDLDWLEGKEELKVRDFLKQYPYPIKANYKGEEIILSYSKLGVERSISIYYPYPVDSLAKDIDTLISNVVIEAIETQLWSKGVGVRIGIDCDVVICTEPIEGRVADRWVSLASGEVSLYHNGDRKTLIVYKSQLELLASVDEALIDRIVNWLKVDTVASLFQKAVASNPFVYSISGNTLTRNFLNGYKRSITVSEKAIQVVGANSRDVCDKPYYLNYGSEEEVLAKLPTYIEWLESNKAILNWLAVYCPYQVIDTLAGDIKVVNEDRMVTISASSNVKLGAATVLSSNNPSEIITFLSQTIIPIMSSSNLFLYYQAGWDRGFAMEIGKDSHGRYLRLTKGDKTLSVREDGVYLLEDNWSKLEYISQIDGDVIAQHIKWLAN